jgi:hypothetical protein
MIRIGKGAFKISFLLAQNKLHKVRVFHPDISMHTYGMVRSYSPLTSLVVPLLLS